ncbi:trypsin-like peptidase domain-containing protein [Citricoccus sp.]|uniref:trypsin-like peptidase domain-containing protein n=1 Tax=Citricoccus sp. TaxID=1978372 RepID=UPI0028BEEFE1|nr:trypsin-like peptidase domain-containing protein [Citricoccus sp.]
MTGTDPTSPDRTGRPCGGQPADTRSSGRPHPETAALPTLSAAPVPGTGSETPAVNDPATGHPDAATGDRPRRIRWSVAALAVAGLMVAGGVGGVVAESAGDETPDATSSTVSADAADPASGTSAQTISDPVTLAEALDRVHDGISVPAEGSTEDGTDVSPEGTAGSGAEIPAGPSGGYSFGGPEGARPGGAGSADEWGTAGTEVDAGVEVPDADGILEINTASALGEGAGTGMVLSSDGLALTNYHVVDGSSEVEVTVADTGQTYLATVVGRDATQDVAVLQLQEATGLETISVDASGVETGESVAAIGNGSGQGYLTAVSGGVTAVDQSISAASLGDTEDLTGLIETDADVVPGYSGGPLVDGDGQVVGMSTAASTGQTSEQVNGYAIDIIEALDIADQIVAGTESDTVQVGSSGALGVTITDAAPSGAGLVDVSAGSAAENAGMEAGDVLTAADGTEVTNAADLSDLIQSLDPGDAVNLEWTDTDGTAHSATVELGASTVN